MWPTNWLVLLLGDLMIDPLWFVLLLPHCGNGSNIDVAPCTCRQIRLIHAWLKCKYLELTTISKAPPITITINWGWKWYFSGGNFFDSFTVAHTCGGNESFMAVFLGNINNSSSAESLIRISLVRLFHAMHHRSPLGMTVLLNCS